MHTHVFARVVVHVEAGDLTPAQIPDAKMAVEVGAMICEASKIELVIGPAAPQVLLEVGIEVPVDAGFLDDRSGKRSVLAGLAASDLLVIPTQSDPVTTVNKLVRDDRSVVAVTRYQRSATSSDGAVTVTMPP